MPTKRPPPWRPSSPASPPPKASSPPSLNVKPPVNVTKESRAKLIRDRLRAKLGKALWVPPGQPLKPSHKPEKGRTSHNYATIFGDITGRTKERVEWVWAPLPKPKVALVQSRTGDQHPISKIAREMYAWNRMDWRDGP